MELTRQRAPEDYVFEHPVVAQARVIVDAVSLTLLRGSTVDFATELIGSSLRVVNNPQAVGSGCGCGVSWEAKSQRAFASSAFVDRRKGITVRRPFTSST